MMPVFLFLLPALMVAKIPLKFGFFCRNDQQKVEKLIYQEELLVR